MIPWQEILGKMPPDGENAEAELATPRTMAELKRFLDVVHIRHCLVKPYQTSRNYPVVEPRELLPSFESDMYEYKNLPAFALVAFNRQLDYFSEIFQYDKLHPMEESSSPSSCPLENQIIGQNLLTLASRIPKALQQNLRKDLADLDSTQLGNYETILPYLLNMDRAHVLSLGSDGVQHLSGIFASFPSDIDSELKRFGLKIGKFAYGDNKLYERNRIFVYQYLMELYGFPVASERRTSSALFARKLHKMGEDFLLRVLGQTDRAITTFTAHGENKRYPSVEKIALVKVARDQQEAIASIERRGFFLDRENRVIIMRVAYRQHRYDPDNLRQDRALSVTSQEIIHPLTGEVLTGLNIVKDPTNIFIRLNDIVRGEYNGRIIYKRSEVVENTDTDQKRLKFLYTWLLKHKRRMISNSEDFFQNVNKVILSYLQSPQKRETFDSMHELYQEVTMTLSYIQQARQVRRLQDLAERKVHGQTIGYQEMCHEAVALLTSVQFELVNFFPDLVEAIIKYAGQILKNPYLQRKYLQPPEHELTKTGLEIRKNYGRLVTLVDDIKAVARARLSSAPQALPEVVYA